MVTAHQLAFLENNTMEPSARSLHFLACNIFSQCCPYKEMLTSLRYRNHYVVQLIHCYSRHPCHWEDSRHYHFLQSDMNLLDTWDR